ncbi:hypothetical protein Pmani_034998 [Petrolisthes manimaculis]|uniref:Uncharacterized protein n=1 Tax=Petrolisthes manimaculis TaxID=1843537 RepID=A0AAE1NMZ5_9EUCA|nr:hypothetical protein Pmani_034998 [Petrolisthes manimaculis]
MGEVLSLRGGEERGEERGGEKREGGSLMVTRRGRMGHGWMGGGRQVECWRGPGVSGVVERPWSVEWWRSWSGGEGLRVVEIPWSGVVERAWSGGEGLQ